MSEFYFAAGHNWKIPIQQSGRKKKSVGNFLFVISSIEMSALSACKWGDIIKSQNRHSLFIFSIYIFLRPNRPILTNHDVSNLIRKRASSRIWAAFSYVELSRYKQKGLRSRETYPKEKEKNCLNVFVFQSSGESAFQVS